MERVLFVFLTYVQAVLSYKNNDTRFIASVIKSYVDYFSFLKVLISKQAYSSLKQ
jgi:hypothetical protein